MSVPAVLIAHGSPDPRSAAVVRDIAAASGAIASFLDFDDPHPVAVLTELADAGVAEAVVVPLLLTRAYHGRVDVPQVIDTLAQARPQLSIRVTAPVGDPWLLPALARPLPDCDAVVLAAAGSSDPAALSTIADLSRRLSGHIGVPALPGYASTAKPTVGEAVRRLRSRGAERVAVASFFIAEGRLHDRVVEHAAAAGAIAVAPPLGAGAELIEVIRSRYSRPSERLLLGVSNNMVVPIPSTQAASARFHTSALAR